MRDEGGGGNRKGKRREYPSGLDEALSDAVEEGMAEVEEPGLLQAPDLVQQRPRLQVTVAAHVSSLDGREEKLKFLLDWKKKETGTRRASRV